MNNLRRKLVLCKMRLNKAIKPLICLAIFAFGIILYMLASFLRHETPKNSRKSFPNDYMTLEKSTKVMESQDGHLVQKDSGDGARVSQRLHDIPRVVEYCNSPRNPVTGQEGEAPEGFRLRMVHIFLRHGDRTAHHEIPGYTPEPVQCYVDQTLINSNTKLKAFIPTMERFAGKQPPGSYFQNWALLPNKTLCGQSSLTGIGAVQHLKLGQHFHEKYVTQNDLFSKKVALTSQIYTRSTVSSRTYQSAIAFLYGFLPFRSFNLTNLYIENNSDTSFCSPQHSRQKSCYCSYGNIMHQQNHNTRRYFVRTSEKGKQVLNSVAKTFGFSPEKVSSFSLLMDIFSLAACHNMSNPCNSYDDRSCLSVPQYRQVWNSLDEEGKFLIHESRKTYSEFSNIVLHPLFIEMARRIKEEIEKKQPYKVVIYSGHDVTLTPLLVVLGLDDGKWVRYASRFVIEFYEAVSKKDKQKYYLKFLFNGEDMTEKVRFCEGRTFHGLCSFRLFYDFVFTEMLQQFKYTSYYDACSRK